MYWEPLRPTEILLDRLEPADVCTGSRSDSLGNCTPIGDPQTDWDPVDRRGAPADRLGAAKLTGAYHKYHTDWSPVEVLGATQTDWGPAHQLAPRRPTWSFSSRLESSGPQTDWEMQRPAGAPHTGWDSADLLGAAQTDK